MKSSFKIDRNSVRRGDDEPFKLPSFEDIMKNSDLEMPSDSLEEEDEQFEEEEEVDYVEQAKQEAQEIIEEAERQAGVIISHAKVDGEAIRADAEQEGFAAGYSEISEQLSSERSKEILAFETAMQTLREGLDDAFIQLENSVMMLSFDIAEQILGMQLERDEKAYISLIRKAVSMMRDAGTVSLKVGKHTHELFFMNRNSSIYQEIEDMNMQVSIDPTLEPFGCVMTSEFGTLDAGLKSQLEKMKELLMKTWGAGG